MKIYMIKLKELKIGINLIIKKNKFVENCIKHLINIWMMRHQGHINSSNKWQFISQSSKSICFVIKNSIKKD